MLRPISLRQFSTVTVLLAASLTAVGCERPATSPASPVVPLPMQQPANRDATVDVNPPGGGIHVNVPPNENGKGVQVDVGPGGVNVQTPDR
jgi:hypothetical protein